MGFMWGSFADGFTRGFQNGWDLGDKITGALDKAEFRSSVDKADKKAEDSMSELNSGRKATKERNKARKQAVETGSDSLVKNTLDVPTDSAIHLGPTSSVDPTSDKDGNSNYLQGVRASGFEEGIRRYGTGNIDLSTRPEVINDDGSTSTVRGGSYNIDGKEVLLPHVSDDGKTLSKDEAIRQYMTTGKHLGRFDTPQQADEYAVKLHNNQAQMLADRREARGSLAIQPDALQGAPVEEGGRKSAVTMPTADDMEHEMTDQEYRLRRQEIVDTQKRETLMAQLGYLKKHDIEKYMETKRSLYDLDTDISIRKTIQGAMNGDSASIGVMVKTLQQLGYFPEGAQFSEGANGGVRVTDANGKTIWDGQVTPELIQKAVPYFAMGQKYISNGNYDKVIELSDSQHKRRNEDTKLDLEKIKTNNDMIRTNVAVGNYELQRQLLAAKGGSQGNGLTYKQDGESMVGFDAQGRPTTRILTNTNTHEQMEIPYTWTEDDVLKAAKGLPEGVSLNFASGIPVVQKGNMAMTYSEFISGSKDWHPVAQPKGQTQAAPSVPGLPNPTGANLHGYDNRPAARPGHERSEPAKKPAEAKKSPEKKAEKKTEKKTEKKAEKKAETKKAPEKKRVSEAELRARLSDENMTKHTSGFVNLAGSTWDAVKDTVAPARRRAWADKPEEK